MSRRSFSWMAVAVTSTVGGLVVINRQPTEPVPGQKNGTPGPLRRILDFNGQVSSALSSNRALAETYPKSMARIPKENGLIGLSELPALENYQIEVKGLGTTKILTLDQVYSLAKLEVVSKFKCIEGWSQIVHAGGCAVSSLLRAVGANPEQLPRYAYLATPDESYYVGLETKALLHPQTLLAWELDGKQLEPGHGAPLRLFVPTKYGIKSIKRVGLIRFQNERPTDFWYERGYDWYAGH